MTPERIAAIRTLLDAATPGPWTQDDDLVRWEGNNAPGGTGRQGVCQMNSATGNAKHDAALIAAAPTVIAELLAEAEWLRSRREFDMDAIKGLSEENERLQRALAAAAVTMTDRERAG